MRILILTAKLPYPLTGGAEIRNFSLLRETARRHEVCLLSFLAQPTDRDYFPTLANHCTKVVGIDLRRPRWRKALHVAQSCLSTSPFILLEYRRREMARAILELVASEKIDVIHAHFLHMGQYAQQKSVAAFVYDAHNLEHVLWKRFASIQKSLVLKAFAKLQCGKFITWQRLVAQNSEKVVTLSDNDRDEYLRIAPDADVTTVPNGVDVDFFRPSARDVEPNMIIYFGNFGWPPQDDAAVYFHNEILPLIRKQCPDVRLYLVGKTPSESIRSLASERVIVTGFVKDIREYIARAAVVVMPLRVGAGTKHRIFQALAMQKALVSTTVGAEGIALKHGETALIADTPQEFAEQTVRLLKDAALRRRLGENGRRFVLEHHDWRAIYNKLEEVFQSAVKKKRAKTIIAAP